jgi:nucleoside phosphorylase
MGAAATERALDWTLRRKPARVIVAGFCGGLDESLEVGRLVQPVVVCDQHGGAWPVPPCPRIGMEGRLVSALRPILGAVDREALRARSGAVAVDLESATAARILHAQAVPFACLRIISDDARSALPEDLAAVLSGEHVNACRLLRAILRRPALVADLWRLARQTRLAARRLADGLEQLLRAWGPGAGQVSAAAISVNG